MIQSVNLTNDIFWLGILDPHLDVFDIIMETKDGTTYNSYLVQTTEGAILVETVKEKFFDAYLQKIEEKIELNTLLPTIPNPITLDLLENSLTVSLI